MSQKHSQSSTVVGLASLAPYWRRGTHSPWLLNKVLLLFDILLFDLLRIVIAPAKTMLLSLNGWSGWHRLSRIGAEAFTLAVKIISCYCYI